MFIVRPRPTHADTETHPQSLNTLALDSQLLVACRPWLRRIGTAASRERKSVLNPIQSDITWFYCNSLISIAVQCTRLRIKVYIDTLWRMSHISIRERAPPSVGLRILVGSGGSQSWGTSSARISTRAHPESTPNGAHGLEQKP